MPAVFAVDALEVLMFAIDDEGRQIEGVAKGGRATLADLPAPVEGVPRVVQAGIEPGIGNILVRRAEIADGITFGVDRGRQDPADSQGRERGSDRLDALLQLLFDLVNLRAQHLAEIEDAGQLLRTTSWACGTPMDV